LQLRIGIDIAPRGTIRLNRHLMEVIAMTPSYAPRAESLGIDLSLAFDAVLARIAGGDRRPVGFGRLRELLEALPLASAEFGVAVNRLANAQRYLCTAEPAAARYELNLLRRSLKR
jgi:hypothetical protein